MILLIRVVNLVIKELSTANDNFCDLRVWQSDGVSSGCHFVLQMTTGWHPIRFTFWKKIINRMECHLVVILQMWTG